jgi:hypothetical protein
VQTEPTPSFVLFGGDAAHHVGLLRPSAFVPLPAALAATLPDGLRYTGGDTPTYDTPFLRVPPKGVAMHHDRDAAEAVVASLQAYDGREDVWVLVAHDGSVRLGGGEGVPVFPADINDWRERGFKEQTRWAFLENANPYE